MINDNEIKKIIEEFFEKTGFAADINVLAAREGGGAVISITARAEDPEELVGRNGNVLFDIQHILKLILKKKIAEYFRLDLDINDYKKKKNDYIAQEARLAADEVSLMKREKEFPPMPPYERRIAHLALAERKDVVVESAGKEPYRRIIIKPCL